MTTKDHIDAAITALEGFRVEAPGAPAREFSLAITALEDAQMRLTRGFAKKLGVFAPADLEKIGDDPAGASAFLAERDQKAHEEAAA